MFMFVLLHQTLPFRCLFIEQLGGPGLAQSLDGTVWYCIGVDVVLLFSARVQLLPATVHVGYTQNLNLVFIILHLSTAAHVDIFNSCK